jgi:hypothetical protein
MVPRPASPPTKQGFKIMQRSVGVDGSHSRGVSANGEAEEGAAKKKTLEEREADYALAKERIYGKAENQRTPVVQGDEDGRGRTARARAGEATDLNTYDGNAALYPVYPSLYHPPKPDALSNISQQIQYTSTDPNFAFQMNGMQYSPYTQGSGYVNGTGQYPIQQGVPFVTPQNGQAYGMQQPYVDGNGNQMYMPQNGYPGGQQWHQQGYPGMIPVPGQMPMPQMGMNGSNTPNGWYPGQIPMMGGPMPMIPQGVQAFPTQYAYPPQMSQNHLVQPTPLRPQTLHHHSSASSSISSRSYQDGSRPHSRGSTTSTRSATSSVRLGAMYPGGGGPNYRQKGMKGQGLNGMTSLGWGDRGQRRAHSPVSDIQPNSGKGKLNDISHPRRPLPQSRHDGQVIPSPFTLLKRGNINSRKDQTGQQTTYLTTLHLSCRSHTKHIW